MKVDDFIEKVRLRNLDPVRVVAADQLWKTGEIVDYIQETVYEFARETEYWLDRTTTSICQLPVIASQRWAKISDKIIRIRRAKLDGQTSALKVIDSINEDNTFPNWDDDTTNTGTIRMLMTGEETGKVFFDRLPIEDGLIRLAVVRYPLEPIKIGAELCVPDQWVLELIPGVRSKMYAKQDADTFDANKSLDLKTEHDKKMLKIRHEIAKLRHHPRVTKYRDLG